MPDRAGSKKQRSGSSKGKGFGAALRKSVELTCSMSQKKAATTIALEQRESGNI